MTTPSGSRKEAVNRFFTRTPQPPNYGSEYVKLSLGGAGILLGIITFAAGMSQGSGGVGTGLCCGFVFGLGGLIFGILGLVKYLEKRNAYQSAFKRAEPKPPASWIRQLLLDDLKRIETRSLQALGIDAADLRIEAEVAARLRQLAIAAGQISTTDTDRHPFIIVGPTRDTRFAQDPDLGTLLFERCAVSVICPIESQFCIYDCTLHLDTGAITIEETRQYPYNHVAAVSTLSVAFTITRTNTNVPAQATNLPAQANNVAPQANYDFALEEFELQYLKIQVSSGSAAEISCGLVSRMDRNTLVSSLTPGFTDAVDTVRAALRQRGAFRQSGNDAFTS